MKKYHGPVRHELTVDQLDRISNIWDKIKYFNDNLETFELNFMRDAHPEKEIKIWENIVNAIEFCVERVKKNNQKVSFAHKKTFYQEILKITVGHYTNEQILSDENLKVMAFAYWQAKKNNP